ncbi:lysophospholipid acyltransferase family protein [Tropicibacter sp. R15_0]|uniref:lysophospholipid acyltransferase family protein n=1 Tax=Tropicibacter sp. R15_0 TaxID=2821101 RepID=UPI001ADC4A1F|nr:lysophospholipid acyltransferase family protein [Tropicibacter sp. R15_0]MBO9466097.1 lysophospholipid acyltransferase family protein [Tropicibacter sp. R15_0]
MKDRIDPLIQERAPWLFNNRPETAPARHLLNAMLGYERTIAIAETLQDMSSDQLMLAMGDLLARDVETSGLHNLPVYGPALVVANHPTGIADGIILHHILRRIRPDAYYFANHDILRVLPQMSDMIAPVEWRKEKRSHGKTRETMAFTRKAVEDGRLGVIFPSGRLAKRRKLSLHERPWMASAAMIARKFDLPVIPVNIRARNSALFYLFDLIHPTLRDITLFHETLNKSRQPFRITVGEPISAAALPAKSEDGIAMLRKATLALGGNKAPAVSLVDATKRPSWL